MKILTLSGWGQQHGTLADIVPKDAAHFDYADYTDIERALHGIADAARGCDVVVGWSLGGQLAVRAVAAGLMRPNKLVLIGVPFQFVHSDKHKIGMPRDTFSKFRNNYEKNPARTLSKAWDLIVLNDKNHEQVMVQLEKYDKAKMLKKDWLRWLDMLDGFSCRELDFSGFPPSLILQGAQDAVVGHTQAHEFAKMIPQAKHIILPDAGHAPHWHDPHLVRQHIEEYLRV